MAVKTLVGGEVLTYLAKILQSSTCPADKTAQLIAEIAKIGKFVSIHVNNVMWKLVNICDR